MRKTAIILSLCLIQVAYSVTIWSEDFTSYSDNSGYIGSAAGAVTAGDYPSSVTKWTLNVSAATLNSWHDWFMVNSVSSQNLFETRDSDGECIWTSESITISGYTQVGIQVTVTESGTHESDDYIKLYYILDSGSETIFETNGNNVDDFTSVTASHSNLSGSTLKIVIKTSNNAGPEYIRFDDVTVTGTASGSVNDPSSLAASVQSSSQIDLTWTDNANSDNVLLAWNSSSTFGTPTDGSTYSVSGSISGGGTVLQYSATDSYSHTSLTGNTTYYYKAWSYDGSNYSSGITTNATTLKVEPTNHPTSLSATTSYQSIALAWTDAATGSQAPDGYLILGETDATITNPLDGTAVSDDTDPTGNAIAKNVTHGSGASYTFSSLTASTAYYFEIFSYTNSGSSIDYKTDGTIITANATTGTTPVFVINEILADPDASTGDANGDGTVSITNDEFVEIINNSGVSVDISSWVLSDAASDRHTVASGTTIADGEALVIFGGGTPTNINGHVFTASTGALGLNNSSDVVTLKDASSGTIVSYTYGSEAGDNQSIARSSDLSGSFVKHSTISATGGVNFSPGRKNSSIDAFQPFNIVIAGNAGFRMMSSPVSGQIYGDLLAELWTQGIATGADVTDGTANIWVLNGYTGTQSWTALTDISASGNSLTAGQGFLVFVFADNNWDGTDDLPVTLSITGTENSSSVTLGSIADGKWALVGNPYASTIDWDIVTRTSLASTAYVWDDATTAFLDWNGSTGGLTNGLIAPFQSFWVQASGGTGSITIEIADKSTSAGTFYRTVNDSVGSASLTFSSNGYEKTIYFSFNLDGELTMDLADAYQLMPLQMTNHLIAMTYANQTALSINNLPVVYESEVQVPLDVMMLNVENGQFIPIESDGMVTWDLSNMPSGISLSLINQASGETTLLTDGESILFTTMEKDGFTYPEGTVNSYPIVDESLFVLSVSNSQLGNEDQTLPTEFALHPVYPNPFNPSTMLSFDLPNVDDVLLSVFNINGQLVETLIHKKMKPGTHKIQWNPVNLSSGVYMVKIKAGQKTFTQKITYIK